MSGGALLLDRRRLATLRPLLPARSPAEWHAALVAEITAGLGPAHAAVLATPVAEGEELAWYAPGSRSRGFTALPVADRRALTEALAAILSDIRRLGESGAAPNVAAAWPSLREVPDLDAVFAVDGRPVLTAWAQKNARAERPAGLLARFDDGLPWQPPPRFPVRAWALAGGALAALALAAGVLLPLAGAALSPDALPQCTVDPASLAVYQEANREAERQDALEAELARLEEERGRRRITCPLPVAPPPTPPPERRAEAPRPPPPSPAPRPQPPPPSPDAERAARAGGRTGRLQVILAWEDTNDLDLYITCPSGQTLGPDNLRACGGSMDVDANRGGAGPGPNLTRTPVENAVWERPPPGRYRVHVNACCGTVRQPPGSAFRITIRQAGQPDRVVPGYARAGGGSGGPGMMVTEFTVPPP